MERGTSPYSSQWRIWGLPKGEGRGHTLCSQEGVEVVMCPRCEISESLVYLQLSQAFHAWIYLTFHSRRHYDASISRIPWLIRVTTYLSDTPTGPCDCRSVTGLRVDFPNVEAPNSVFQDEKICQIQHLKRPLHRKVYQTCHLSTRRSFHQKVQIHEQYIYLFIL
jgi:hypothetical protein